MNDKLRFPPFGKILSAYQEQKVRLEFPIYIHVGEKGKEYAFTDIKSGSMASFLPYGEDYALYNWPVFNQKIIVCDHGSMEEIYLDKFCFYLLYANARIVYLHSQEHPCKFFKGDLK